MSDEATASPMRKAFERYAARACFDLSRVDSSREYLTESTADCWLFFVSGWDEALISIIEAQKP